MDIPSFVTAIEQSALGDWMRMSVKAMPFVEATHVLAAAAVFGTILIVDLRLIGFRDTANPFTRISRELMHYTWGAFAISVVTGVMMFAANASTYYGNTAFRLKMLALIVAGVNMAIFEFGTSRSVASWDKATVGPVAARVAGVTSILIWVSVMFIARWIGFTKGYNYAIPEGVELNFDFPAQ
jgi:hypothetical protein